MSTIAIYPSASHTREQFLWNSETNQSTDLVLIEDGLMIKDPRNPLIVFLIPHTVLEKIRECPGQGFVYFENHDYCWRVGEDFAHLTANIVGSEIKNPTIEFPIKNWKRMLEFISSC